MSRFRQRAIPFTERSLDDDWNALFYMQHYRVPTRLLDWSENPFIALYFAVYYANFRKRRGAPNLVAKHPSAVWVLDPAAWNQHALRHQTFDGGVLSAASQELIPYKPSADSTGMLNEPVAMFGAHNSARIVAQRGVFCVFGRSTDPMESIYDSSNYPQHSLTRIVLGDDVVYSIRKSLLTYGITESVVYPDLEGLAAEIRRTFGFEGS